MGATLVVEHCECEENELISCFREENIISYLEKENSLLIIATRSANHAALWGKEAGCTRINLPLLSERNDCFLPLTLSFSNWIKTFAQAKKNILLFRISQRAKKTSLARKYLSTKRLPLPCL